jgi:hypothetical protein
MALFYREGAAPIGQDIHYLLLKPCTTITATALLQVVRPETAVRS